MINPVLVEVTRGGLVESRHRGAVAVLDADGAVVQSIGDIECPVFPRSAVKPLQALPLVETGAADKFNLSDSEIALACSSHAAEPGHIETVNSMLAKIGLDQSTLECGCQRPTNEVANLALAEQRQSALATHNTCSGKHAGFLCLACYMGVDHAGYIGCDHAVQREVRNAMESMTGAAHREDLCGADGCSIPTYAVPLKSIALGFAKFATGLGIEPVRAKVAKRIFDACVENSWYVAGTERACTRIMQAGKRRVLAKTGAEGVYCAAIPELGLGIAIKCDDGTTRAAETIVATVIASLLPKGDQDGEAIRAIGQQVLKNRNGIEVGEVRATGLLS
jgi:L-asparaginase II